MPSWDMIQKQLENPIVMAILTIVIVLHAILGACSYLIWLERKLSAWMQDRVGPNRVGVAGLLQPIADGAKFLLKEDVIPGHVNTFLYMLAPCIAVFTTMLAFSVVPFGPVSDTPGSFPFIIAPNVDLGLVFIFAIGSLSIYSIILGGWASNNKYSALGSLRASAQVVSYEIPLGMSIIGLALMHSTMNIEQLLLVQTNSIWSWNIWYQPVAALIFFTAALAESNRLPFDLTECEQELVGGFHTEYSAMKFAMFFLGEYTHVITVSMLTIVLFFGGWHFPVIAEASSAYFGSTFVKVMVLLTKALLVIIVIQMLRWTIPRFRFDQLMGLAWKVLIPMATVNVLLTMTVLEFGVAKFWLLPLSVALFVSAGLISTQSGRSKFARASSAANPMQGSTAVAAGGH
jgi:NADH-quinone oxidoreductase subunit H